MNIGSASWNCVDGPVVRTESGDGPLEAHVHRSLLALTFAACSNTVPISPTSSIPVTSPSQTVERAPRSTTPTVASSPTVVCRLAADACTEAIGLVRESDPLDVARAQAIVVADVCPPTVACDRLYPFDSLVVLVPIARPREITIAFEVTGINRPERVVRFAQALPAHIAALVANVGG